MFVTGIHPRISYLFIHKVQWCVLYNKLNLDQVILFVDLCWWPIISHSSGVFYNSGCELLTTCTLDAWYHWLWFSINLYRACTKWEPVKFGVRCSIIYYDCELCTSVGRLFLDEYVCNVPALIWQFMADIYFGKVWCHKKWVLYFMFFWSVACRFNVACDAQHDHVRYVHIPELLQL